VQGTVLFPFQTATNDAAPGLNSKLQTVGTVDFQLGRKTVDVFGLPYDVEAFAFVGVAAGSVKVTEADFSDTRTLFGPTLGVGAAVNVTPRVQLYTQFRYIDLLHEDFHLGPTGPGIDVGQRAFIATVGVKVQIHDATELLTVRNRP